LELRFEKHGDSFGMRVNAQKKADLFLEPAKPSGLG
jgi:hypothetical protein